MYRPPPRPNEEPLLSRWLVGEVDRIAHPTTGYCLRCGRTWRCLGIKGHTTPFCLVDAGGICTAPLHEEGLRFHAGCFPLCEDCWSELTPEARLPYYRLLSEFNGRGDEIEEKAIEFAVLAGG